MRTFKRREAKPQANLFKELVLSRQEYLCVLTLVFKANKISVGKCAKNIHPVRTHCQKKTILGTTEIIRTLSSGAQMEQM